MMARRALTMIELLLALGLLSMVMAAVAFWIQTSARTSATVAQPARWHAAAQATLNLVHDDIMSGDFERKNARSKSVKPRIEYRDNQLEIDTRNDGTSHHSYRWDAITKQLLLVQTDHEGRRETRVLLGDVNGWECTPDEANKLLTTSIESINGQTVTRSFAVP